MFTKDAADAARVRLRAKLGSDLIETVRRRAYAPALRSPHPSSWQVIPWSYTAGRHRPRKVSTWKNSRLRSRTWLKPPEHLKRCGSSRTCCQQSHIFLIQIPRPATSRGKSWGQIRWGCCFQQSPSRSGWQRSPKMKMESGTCGRYWSGLLVPRAG